jgi:hypothetical protein
LFSLPGEEHGLLNAEGSSVGFQFLKWLTILERDLRVSLQVEAAIRFDDDHLTSPLTTPVSQEPRYKSRKTENETLKIKVFR